MSRLEVPNDEYTIQSLSELYLAAINPNAEKAALQTHTQNILADLRRRLSMNPQTSSTQNRRRSMVPPSSTNSPLELLFKPPNRFFVTQASQETAHHDTGHHHFPHSNRNNGHTENNSNFDNDQNSYNSGTFNERAESTLSDSQRLFLEKQLTSVTKAQCWVNDFLNRPQNPLSIIYQLFLCVILFIYLLFIIFTDRTTWHKMCKPVDFDKNELTNNAKGLFEDCLIAHFVIFEWFLRFWSSHAKPEYYRIPWVKYVFKYHTTWSHFLDLLIVIAGSISATCEFPLPLDITQDVYAAIVLRGLHRLFMVAEWTTVQARHSPLELILQVFREQGAILFGILYLQSTLILLVAYMVFHAERHSPDAVRETGHLNNMLDAFYWATVTLLTIGYGDKVPKTYLGKTVTGAGILFGMALFSLPAGIIATSLALKISERDAIELRHLKRTYAATIIQQFWRFVQREKRFQKALLIVSRYPDLKDCDDKEFKIIINRTQKFGRAGKRPKVISLNPKLKEQIFEVNKRRFEFYASQFIDLLKLSVLKQKFTDLLKRQQGSSQLANSWQMIKAHWIEHQSLTELLENTNLKVQSSTDKVVHNISVHKEELARNKLRLHEFTKIETELTALYKKLLEEKELLQRLAAFDGRPKPATDNDTNNKHTQVQT